MRQKAHFADDDPSAAVASAGVAGAEEEPPTLFSGDAAVLGDRHLEVWDERKMAELVAMMGSQWVETRLGEFSAHLERRLDLLASARSAAPPELARNVHALMGMAGFFGFGELLAQCARVQRQARQGAPVDGLEELRVAGERVCSAIRWKTRRAPNPN